MTNDLTCCLYLHQGFSPGLNLIIEDPTSLDA